MEALPGRSDGTRGTLGVTVPATAAETAKRRAEHGLLRRKTKPHFRYRRVHGTPKAQLSLAENCCVWVPVSGPSIVKWKNGIIK